MREHAHQLIDLLPETQLTALVRLLESMVEPEEVSLDSALMDDEPETESERAAVAEARAVLRRSGGIPHVDAMRRLGL